MRPTHPFQFSPLALSLFPIHEHGHSFPRSGRLVGEIELAFHIPAPTLICLTVFLSSTTNPLALKLCSSASNTRSKDGLAPLFCVKRAMAMLARRPRWRRVWNSAAMERGGYGEPGRESVPLCCSNDGLVESEKGHFRGWRKTD